MKVAEVYQNISPSIGKPPIEHCPGKNPLYFREEVCNSLEPPDINLLQCWFRILEIRSSCVLVSGDLLALDSIA